jgi:hypothetical protein
MAHGNAKRNWVIISHIHKNGEVTEHRALTMASKTATEARRAFKIYLDLVTYSEHYQSYRHSELWEQSNCEGWELAVTHTHNYFNKS